MLEYSNGTSKIVICVLVYFVTSCKYKTFDLDLLHRLRALWRIDLQSLRKENPYKTSSEVIGTYNAYWPEKYCVSL